MMKFRYSPWLLLLLFLSSCYSPRELTTISPVAPQGTYAMGREYISLESERVAVELGYDGIQGEQLVFDFVVHNGSSDTLAIHPSDFFYVILDSADEASSMESFWTSLHPDTVLMNYDQSLEERKKHKDMNTFLGIMQAGIDLLYNTTGFLATEDPGFIVDAVFRTAGTAEQYIAQDKAIGSEITWIAEEKELVREEIFRSCQIPPDRVHSGYVYFPLQRECPYYMFCFPVGEELFQFVYSQERELVY